MQRKRIFNMAAATKFYRRYLRTASIVRLAASTLGTFFTQYITPPHSFPCCNRSTNLS